MGRYLFLNNFETLGRITFDFKDCPDLPVSTFPHQQSSSIDMDWEYPISNSPVLLIRNLSLVLGPDEG